ncbi:MAG: hypothetical protein M0Z41_14580 [Peptococcaceae bacterium]|nr:hypothetical protein [Peptococcaceae bacterium]
MTLKVTGSPGTGRPWGLTTVALTWVVCPVVAAVGVAVNCTLVTAWAGVCTVAGPLVPGATFV